MKYEELGRGIVKRAEKRVVGLFIDGTGLDRATRRLNRKVEMSALVKGVAAGMTPIVARYYTMIPYEDDSRQRSFLDAVAKSGLQVIVRRLPPKGVNRQVSVDIEMASDIMAFSLGHNRFSNLSEYQVGAGAPSLHDDAVQQAAAANASMDGKTADSSKGPDVESPKIRRVITVVCPSRDLSYPIALARELGVDTVSADFGEFAGQDVLKSAAKWIDLSGSETIWRE